MNDFIIRLNMSDTTLPEGRQKSEVMKMDNHMMIDSIGKETENHVLKLYFSPRKWTFNRDCRDNVGNRSFITGPDGVLAESYMLGDWSSKWTEIVSETLLLPKNTDCSFTFWLNGGENDRNDEVCRFEVLFNNNYEQRLTYNLNRNYISPIKKLNGWELYEIPFRTEDNEYTQLRFVAQRAYLTILTAKDVSAYAEFPDTIDPFEGERPQRHNIIFSDGFPASGWYSTRALQEAHRKRAAADSASRRNEGASSQNGFQENSGIHAADSNACQLSASAAASVKEIFDEVRKGKYSSAEDFEDVVASKGEIAQGIMENALQNLGNALQQITSEFQANANVRLNAISTSLNALSSICDMLESLDVESLADNISIKHGEDYEEELEDILSDTADSISDMADELRDSIEEMADQIEEIRDSLSI